ncbi:hypothetical protein Fot_34331 [Forsythia ovata]|uniref:Uncharacterized protein n=1 Tax=Forsythia ovata TaxID=205694 RepID=A0ABD1SL82_9LAMI
MQATLIERELIGRQVDTRIRRKNPSSLYDKWKGRLTQIAHIHISLLAIKKTSTRFRYVQEIRRGGVVDDIPHPPPVPYAASVPRVTVLQTSKIMVGSSSFTFPAPGVTSGVSSDSFPARHVPSLKNSRQSGKRKTDANSKEEAFRTHVPPPAGKYEYINIGSRRDELDPTALGKLPASASIAVASVRKYWTSTFGEAADNVELTELLKLVEMYTSWSHVLSCELYKVLAIKVDKLRSVVGRDEEVNALRSENKDLRERLAFFEDARARAIYDITKAKRIQGVCVQA